jgi:hypothetical protein
VAWQPEVGLRFYRRLLQMGAVSPELWNNLGLSCFYASQVCFVSEAVAHLDWTFRLFPPPTPHHSMTWR